MLLQNEKKPQEETKETAKLKNVAISFVYKW